MAVVVDTCLFFAYIDWSLRVLEQNFIDILRLLTDEIVLVNVNSWETYGTRVLWLMPDVMLLFGATQ